MRKNVTVKTETHMVALKCAKQISRMHLWHFAWGTAERNVHWPRPFMCLSVCLSVCESVCLAHGAFPHYTARTRM